VAIDNIDIIDLIGIDKHTGEVILTISDHLDWADIYAHLDILQNKINRYINFVESGEIYEHKKEALEKRIVIEVFGKYNLPIEAVDFLKAANVFLTDLKVEVRFMPSMQ
jgi:hypothetical protein